MRNSWRAAALFVVAVHLFSGPVVAEAVLTQSGAIQGVRTNGLTVYKGVPFAVPPLGALRWREPQPVAPWKGVRVADAFARLPAKGRVHAGRNAAHGE